MPAIDPISEILSDTLNRFIRPRRRVQATAIATLIKHIIEGSERRYQRLGAEAYRNEYNQVRLAIVHPNVAKHIYDITHEKGRTGGHTGKGHPTDQGPAGIAHHGWVGIHGTDVRVPYSDDPNLPGAEDLPSRRQALDEANKIAKAYDEAKTQDDAQGLLTAIKALRIARAYKAANRRNPRTIRRPKTQDGAA